MSTQFPEFNPKSSDELWMNSNNCGLLNSYDDELELCLLERRYQKWMHKTIEKDNDIAVIGKKKESGGTNETEADGESDETEEEEEEEEEMVGFQESSELQNPPAQVNDMDLDTTEEDNASNGCWMI